MTESRTITLLGDRVAIAVDQPDFYPKLLAAIADHVFKLLGPEFDKRAYLEEVTKERFSVEIGQELAIPVSILLSLNLGYCLGQLKGLDRTVDCDEALQDLYNIWRAKLNAMLLKEATDANRIH